MNIEYPISIRIGRFSEYRAFRTKSSCSARYSLSRRKELSLPRLRPPWVAARRGTDVNDAGDVTVTGAVAGRPDAGGRGVGRSARRRGRRSGPHGASGGRGAPGGRGRRSPGATGGTPCRSPGRRGPRPCKHGLDRVARRHHNPAHLPSRGVFNGRHGRCLPARPSRRRVGSRGPPRTLTPVFPSRGGSSRCSKACSGSMACSAGSR